MMPSKTNAASLPSPVRELPQVTDTNEHLSIDLLGGFENQDGATGTGEDKTEGDRPVSIMRRW